VMVPKTLSRIETRYGFEPTTFAWFPSPWGGYRCLPSDQGARVRRYVRVHVVPLDLV
jgi:hypothetical protein